MRTQTPEQKAAAKIRRRAYCLANKQHINEAAAQWRRNNPEKVKVSARNNFKKHAIKIKARVDQWWKDNPHKRAEYAAKVDKEKDRERSRLWREVNPEKRRQTTAKWRAANVAAIKEYNQKRLQADPQIGILAQARRRAKKRGNGGVLSKGLLELLWAEQNGKCTICFAKLDVSGHNMDHVMPLALGGANEDWNIQLLCPHCNKRKNVRHPIEFFAEAISFPVTQL